MFRSIIIVFIYIAQPFNITGLNIKKAQGLNTT